MTSADQTCWTMIHAAAGGDVAARDRFARLYEPVAKTYFASRWSNNVLSSQCDDAIQNVFVECFKPAGVLEKAIDDRIAGFQAFFLGVLRNVARRFEDKQKSHTPLTDDHPSDDTSLSHAFDRAWAQSLMREAARVQAANATQSGERAVQRVELLRLRFQQGKPIREIAELWKVDPAFVHHEYAAAREEFRTALISVIAFHNPSAKTTEIESQCRQILDLLK